MFRFFVSSKDVLTKSIRLNADDSGHIRSLRLRPDEKFIICDGNNTDYICQLGERSNGASVEIVGQYESNGEPGIKCNIYIAYSKGDRLDYAVQKSVELGVHEIILFESERCVAVPHDIPKKVKRLQRIALETAKQCNRGIIPVVSSTGKFNTMLDDAVEKSAYTLLFYEDEDNVHLKDIMEQQLSFTSISLITGPEGGFEPFEIDLARSKEIPVISLGPRVLRSETAPVVALAAIMYQTGNL